MARQNVLLGVFSVWMILITFLPLYMLLSGRYSLVKNGREAIRDEGGGSQTDEFMGRMKRGVLVAQDTPRKKDSIFNEPVLKRSHREYDHVGEINLAGYYPAAEYIPNSAIRAEIQRALVVSDQSSNPRAAFELVVELSSLLPKISNISRMKTPSKETFLNYIAPLGMPVIFTDMLEGQMLGQWTWDYIRSKWGDTVFHNTRQGNYSTKTSKNGKHYINRVSVRLSDFIDVVTGRRKPTKSEEGMYITKQKVIPESALEAEFYYPPFYSGAHKNCFLEPTGWIGAPGTLTQGHIDSKDNFVYQIIGEKRWRIFSPVDYKSLYYTKTKGSLEWSSVLTTFDKVDLKKYPLYAKTTPVTFMMKPGEVLYLPRGWTHMVENVTPALMINTWRYGPAAITEHWSKKNREEIKKRCMS